MQFTILGLAFAAVSFANAAAIQARGGEYYSGGSGIPVCPADQSALCCQLDVDGVIDTSCTYYHSVVEILDVDCR